MTMMLVHYEGKAWIVASLFTIAVLWFVGPVEAQTADAYLNDGLALYQAGKFAESIAATNKALAINPDNAIAHNNICAAYNSMARWDEGIAACTRAIQLAPGYELAQNNLAWAMKMVQSELEAAGRHLNESLALYNAGNYVEALTASRKALELRPDYAEAYNNMCAAYNAIGKWDEGIASCTKAIELKPDYELAKNNLAWGKGLKAGSSAQRPSK